MKINDIIKISDLDYRFILKAVLPVTHKVIIKNTNKYGFVNPQEIGNSNRTLFKGGVFQGNYFTSLSTNEGYYYVFACALLKKTNDILATIKNETLKPIKEENKEKAPKEIENKVKTALNDYKEKHRNDTNYYNQIAMISTPSSYWRAAWGENMAEYSQLKTLNEYELKNIAKACELIKGINKESLLKGQCGDKWKTSRINATPKARKERDLLKAKIYYETGWFNKKSYADELLNIQQKPYSTTTKDNNTQNTNIELLSDKALTVTELFNRALCTSILNKDNYIETLK